MTKNQQRQFNSMRATLIQLSKGFYTSDQLRKNSEKEYGLAYEEALEMSYDNMQSIAKVAIKGVRELK